MQLRDYAQKYYDEDYNCAESILLAANQKYHLNIPNEEIALIAGFGGGMCIEGPCGALTGGIAALGKMLVKTRAHDTEGLKTHIQTYITQFQTALGSYDCAPLKDKYKTETDGCVQTVLLAADVLEAFIKTNSSEAN